MIPSLSKSHLLSLMQLLLTVHINKRIIEQSHNHQLTFTEADSHPLLHFHRHCSLSFSYFIPRQLAGCAT